MCIFFINLHPRFYETRLQHFKTENEKNPRIITHRSV